jgi:glycosyltransferase involved in cell wall biosynthesis
MSRLKLLLVTHYVGYGGPAISLRGIVRGYTDADVDLVVPRFAKAPSDDDIRAFFGPRLGRIFRLWLPWSEVYVGHPKPWQSVRSHYLFPVAWRAERARFMKLASRGYDAVHLNSLVLHPMTSTDVPMILHVREILVEQQARVLADAARARGTIFIDEATRKPFQPNLPPRHLVLNNPVDMTGVGTLPRDVERRIGGDPRRLTIFAIIGSISDEKGVPFVVDAFRAAKSPDARLLIVGRTTPAVRSRLERISRGDRRVVIWGEERGIEQVYTLADYVLRGEPYQCIGRTIYEALYAGCAVIVPGDRASHDMFEFDRFADRIHFYPPRDRAALVEHFDTLVTRKHDDKRGESNLPQYVLQFDRFVREAIQTS